MAQNRPPLLTLENVSVEFHVRRGLLKRLFIVHALNNISLRIDESQTLVLAGESGCGKTTLGRVIAGLQPPTSGRILFRGKPLDELSEEEREEYRRSVQLVHQDPYSALNPTKTVYSILSTPYKYHVLRRIKLLKKRLARGDEEARGEIEKLKASIRKEALLEKILSVLEEVKVSPPEEYIFRYPHQLSGGERQRIVLARTLLVDPRLIVADEVISAIDVSLRVDLMDLLIELWRRRGIGYVFVTHELASGRYFAEKTGGNIAIMYLGEIIEIGPARRVIENPLHPYTVALIEATPELDLERLKALRPLPLKRVDIPKATARITGCKFRTRCPHEKPVCAEKKPPMIEVEPNHYVACHLYARGH